MSRRGAFQLRELQWELRHEDAEIGAYNPFNSRSFVPSVKVFIDGKFWKTMPQNQAQKAAQTLSARGKTVTMESL